MPYHAVGNKNMSIYQATYAGRLVAVSCQSALPRLNLQYFLCLSL